MPDMDFNSDHRLLTTAMETPMNRRARRTSRRKKKTPACNLEALQKPVVREAFCDQVKSDFVPLS